MSLRAIHRPKPVEIMRNRRTSRTMGGGGTNKPPNTKGKKTRNRKNKNKDKSKTKTGINEFVPDTTFSDFKDRPIDIHRSVSNFNKHIATAVSYLNKQKQTKLADVVKSPKRPFVGLTKANFITVTNAEVDASRAQEIRFKKQLDAYDDYVTANEVMYSITTSCCSPTVTTQLKMQTEWNKIEADKDFIGLLNILERVCHAGSFGYKLKRTVQVSKAMRKTTGLQQSKGEDPSKFAKRVEEVYEQYVATAKFPWGLTLLEDILDDNGMTIDRFFAKEVDQTADEKDKKKLIEEKYKEECMSNMTLENAADKDPYNACMDANRYGNDQWPDSSNNALQLLISEQTKKNKKNRNNTQNTTDNDKENIPAPDTGNKQVNIVMKLPEPDENVSDDVTVDDVSNEIQEEEDDDGEDDVSVDDVSVTASDVSVNEQSSKLIDALQVSNQTDQEQGITSDQAVAFYTQSLNHRSFGDMFDCTDDDDDKDLELIFNGNMVANMVVKSDKSTPTAKRKQDDRSPSKEDQDDEPNQDDDDSDQDESKQSTTATTIREFTKLELRLMKGIFLYSKQNRDIGSIQKREMYYSIILNKLWNAGITNSQEFIKLNHSSINRKLLDKGESTIKKDTFNGIYRCLRMVNIDEIVIKSVDSDDPHLESKTRSTAKLTGLLLNVAMYTDYLNPTRWANQATNKLIAIKIDTIQKLESAIDDDSLQSRLQEKGQAKFHKMTISIMNKAIKEGLPNDLTFIQEKIQDFQNGGQ